MLAWHEWLPGPSRFRLSHEALSSPSADQSQGNLRITALRKTALVAGVLDLIIFRPLACREGLPAHADHHRR
jgi:hypothetical protein